MLLRNEKDLAEDASGDRTADTGGAITVLAYRNRRRITI